VRYDERNYLSSRKGGSGRKEILGSKIRKGRPGIWFGGASLSLGEIRVKKRSGIRGATTSIGIIRTGLTS